MEEKFSKFRDYRQVDKDWKKVIIDICGNIIRKNPSKEELENLKPYPGSSWKCIENLPDDEKKEYLLEFLRYFYHKKGRVPTVGDFIYPKYPDVRTYKKIFGSWNNAIREIGLQPNTGGGHNRKGVSIYTDEELLRYLIEFYEENGRSPTEKNFENNPKYPGYRTYIRRFGGWQNILKIVGLDVDSMVRYNIIDNTYQKARVGELFILDSFEQMGAIDLSGKDWGSAYDGICPQGYNYDVKTSGLRVTYWTFDLTNEYIDEIEYLYLIAFDKDYTKVIYAWRIPISDFIEYMGKILIIGLNFYRRGYDVQDMKKYEITEKIIPIWEKWINRKKWTKEEIGADVNRRLKIYIENKEGE